MTKKHLQFCIYYMQVGDPQVAYKMTYPRAAVKSLKASVSRLMARPDVAEWVNGTEERVHHRMMRKFYSEHYDDFKEQLLTINQKRTILTKIITGETKRIRYVQAKYGPQRIEEPLPVYAVLRAVDLDTRLENFYNFLTRSDTWRKAQNIYVNTPTLQQQVNILINQTTEQEETKDTQEPTQIKAVTESPLTVFPTKLGEGDRGALAQDTRQSFPLGGARGAHTPDATKISPPRRGARSHCAEGGWVNPRRTNHTKKTPRFFNNRNSRANEAVNKNEKDIDRLTTEPVSSLTQKKDIDRLTIVNNSSEDRNNSAQQSPEQKRE